MDANYPKPCRECGAVQGIVEDLISHIIWQHDPQFRETPVVQGHLRQPRQLETQRQKLVQVQQQFEVYYERLIQEQQEYQRLKQAEQQAQQLQLLKQQRLLQTCSLCHKTFTRKDSFRRHSAIHIRENVTFHHGSQSLNINQPTFSHEDLGSRSDKEHCSICDSSIFETDMDEHMQKIHNRWVAP